jgi:type VI secretion system protein ImpA
MLNEGQSGSFYFKEQHEIYLQPISFEKPCGEYLRRHPLTIKLKELRTQILASNEGQSENLGIWEKKNKEIPTWNHVISLCEEILTTHSKDLQVCAYYAEAKLNMEGVSGLAFALSLMLGFCKEYWNDIYPPLEEDDLELRLSPFHWLQLTLPALISRTPLTEGKTPSGTENVSWYWYEQESKIGANEAAQAKKFLLNTIEKESDESISAMYFAFESILMSLNSLEEEYLSEISKSDDEGASLGEVISFCENISSLLKPLYLKRIEKNSSHSESSQDTEKNFENINSNISNGNQNFSEASYSGGEISSCEEAYQLITKANSYLIKNDPHSPSPYLVRRALEWRKKSLYGVLMELFTTTSKPQEIFTLLGLSSEDKTDEGY